VKPSERIERIMRLAQLANNASVSSHVTAALEHCVALFQELAADVEALKRRNDAVTEECTAPLPNGIRAEPDDSSDPATEDSSGVSARDAADIVRPPWHPLSQARERRRECWLAEYEEDGVLCWGSCRFRHDLEKTCPPGTELHRMVELSEGERVALKGEVVLMAEQAERVRGFLAWMEEHGGKKDSKALDRTQLWIEYSRLDPDDLAALGIEVDRA
jgi:hypothetical protein